MTAASAAVPLDITYGTRGATRCTLCERPMAAADTPLFELETQDERPLCLVCQDKQHKGLRLVCAVMNWVVEQHAAGNKRAAEETINGIALAVELIEESAPKLAYRRPTRRQPVRSNRRQRRR